MLFPLAYTGQYDIFWIIIEEIGYLAKTVIY